MSEMPDTTETFEPGRRWRMWAAARGENFESVGHRQYTEADAPAGLQVVPVTVTVDPEGRYYGWMANGADEPAMIWWHPTAYSMCFAYGPRAEEDAGRGRTVRLTVEPYTG